MSTQEERFRSLYAGKRLGVIGGDPRPHQVRKLGRLGARVVWLPIGRDPHRTGSVLPPGTVNAIAERRIDLLLVFTRCLGHNLFDQAMRGVRLPGRPCLPVARSRTLNTEVIAGLFLAHAGSRPA